MNPSDGFIGNISVASNTKHCVGQDRFRFADPGSNRFGPVDPHSAIVIDCVQGVHPDAGSRILIVLRGFWLVLGGAGAARAAISVDARKRCIRSLTPFPGRSAARRAFAAWCAAEPGPFQTPVLGTVPALRSGMKNAAPRPGHGSALMSLHPRRCLQAACQFEHLLWVSCGFDPQENLNQRRRVVSQLERHNNYTYLKIRMERSYDRVGARF
jgi:hypothetical protein